jgi:hypothetical protein
VKISSWVFEEISGLAPKRSTKSKRYLGIIVQIIVECKGRNKREYKELQLVFITQ